MKRKVALFGFMALAMVLLFTACPVDVTISAGSVAGKVLFTDAENHAGINVILEKVVNGSSASVMRAVSSGQIEASSARAASTGVYVQTTSADGSYLFESVPAGLYVVYAVSANSTLSTVSANVLVQNASRAVVDDLQLVALGSISGTIQLDGNATGNGGILVYIAGTSLMAMTNDAGTFTISNVPVASGYSLTLSKNAFTHALTGSFAVTKGTTTAAGTFQPAASVFEPAPTPTPKPSSEMWLLPTIAKNISASSDADGIYITINLPSQAANPQIDRREVTEPESAFMTVGIITSSTTGQYLFPDYFVEPGHTYEYRVMFRSRTDQNIKDYSYTRTVTALGGDGLLRLRRNIQFNWDTVFHYITEFETSADDIEGMDSTLNDAVLFTNNRIQGDISIQTICRADDIWFSRVIMLGDSDNISLSLARALSVPVLTDMMQTLELYDNSGLYSNPLLPWLYDKSYSLYLRGSIRIPGSNPYTYYSIESDASLFGLPDELTIEQIRVNDFSGIVSLEPDTEGLEYTMKMLTVWVPSGHTSFNQIIEYRPVDSSEPYQVFNPPNYTDNPGQIRHYMLYVSPNSGESPLENLLEQPGVYEMRVSLYSNDGRLIYRYKTVEVTIPE